MVSLTLQTELYLITATSAQDSLFNEQLSLSSSFTHGHRNISLSRTSQCKVFKLGGGGVVTIFKSHYNSHVCKKCTEGAGVDGARGRRIVEQTVSGCYILPLVRWDQHLWSTWVAFSAGVFGSVTFDLHPLAHTRPRGMLCSSWLLLTVDSSHPICFSTIWLECHNVRFLVAPGGGEIPCSLVPKMVLFLYESFHCLMCGDHIPGTSAIFFLTFGFYMLDFLRVSQTKATISCFWWHGSFISAAQTALIHMVLTGL